MLSAEQADVCITEILTRQYGLQSDVTVNITNVLLPTIQAAVIKQDSILEFYLRGSSMAPEGTGGRVVRSLSRDGGTEGGVGELTLLQRQHSLLQEELVRLRGAEGRLKDCEKHRVHLEKQLKEIKSNNSAAPGDSSGTAASRQVEDRAREVQWSIDL